mmetsp:Transcript_25741/g.66762  ORF Transcript_25741/g.66762 Transcript_25741/m.66762 type:complete len:201 (-) Transcript_25741:120-722(-)
MVRPPRPPPAAAAARCRFRRSCTPRYAAICASADSQQLQCASPTTSMRHPVHVNTARRSSLMRTASCAEISAPYSSALPSFSLKDAWLPGSPSISSCCPFCSLKRRRVAAPATPPSGRRVLRRARGAAGRGQLLTAKQGWKGGRQETPRPPTARNMPRGLAPLSSFPALLCRPSRRHTFSHRRSRDPRQAAVCTLRARHA